MNWNPITAIADAVNSRVDAAVQSGQQAVSNVPATTQPAEQEQSPDVKTGVPVESGIWIDAQSLTSSQASTLTADFRRTVESFDEDKMSLGARVVHFVYTTLAYLLPPLLAFIVGMAIGDAFSGQFSLASYWSLYAHIISVSLETAIAMLGLAVAVVFKRALKDKSQMALCIVLALVFLVLGIGNSVSLIFLIDQHITRSDTTASIAVWFRALAPLIVDVVATIYLSVCGLRNLKKYLADQRQKIEAVRDVNQVNIELEAVQLKAGIDKQSALMDMQSKAKRAQTWNEIESMQGQAMIDQARRNLLDSGDGNSYRRSRY